MAKVLSKTEHDIGNLIVKRVLPNKEKKMVGPFIFFDHMGPGTFAPGQGINVRPHPHIGLSTLTYLFEGSILHRDSLGNHLEIKPGDVNWMTAGKGIVHSERETFEVRANPHKVDGLQCWVALPPHMAELEPSFDHVKKEKLPQLIHEGLMMRLVIGEAYGLSSPIKTYWPMFYIDVVGSKTSVVKRPSDKQETAIYPIYGKVKVGGQEFGPGDFVLLEDNDQEIEIVECGRFIMLGGDAFEKAPHIFWNFVSFDRERLNQAKEDWKAGRFPKIPDDHKEEIPLD